MKRPHLFYWSNDAWCPADGLEVDSIISVVLLSDGEEDEIRFKRMDMSDEEYYAIR